MKIKLNNTNRKRVFTLPCRIVDNYLKVADEASLKVLLCLYSSDEVSLEINDVIRITGLDKQKAVEAVEFWTNLGEFSCDETETVTEKVKSKHSKINVSEYAASNPDYKDCLTEAETSVGRILTLYEQEALILLLDYYRFSPTAAILIFEHCAKRELFSAKSVEKLAASLYEKGLVTYEQIEQEFANIAEYYSFESEIKRTLGLYSKLSKKQTEFLNKWKALGFTVEMINHAGEQSINSINKVYFPYMDKVLESWAVKGIFTVEAAEAEYAKAVEEKSNTDRTFDINEFDDFTLGKFIKNKEESK